MNDIPFTDLKAKFSNLKKEILDEIEKVIESGNYILGDQVKKFENEFAKKFGYRHVVGVANGTEALYLALVASQRKGTVLTVANAANYVSTAAKMAGLKVSYVDVNEFSHQPTLDLIKKAYSSDIEILVITHLFGCVNDELDSISAFCATKNIFLIEDCAQAHGAPVGIFGALFTFSFYPTKNLSALGDAGAIGTNDSDLADLLKSLRNYGWSEKYRIANLGGINSRLDEVQAAVLNIQLKYFDKDLSNRRENALLYLKLLEKENRIILPRFFKNNDAFHLFPIRYEKRDLLIEKLKRYGIDTLIHFPIPDHLQLSNNFYWNLPITEKLSKSLVSLPLYSELTKKQILSIVQNLVKALDDCSK